MVRKFPTFRSERKKRTTSGGSPQFPNGFSGKLLFHLTFNRNFRIFWLNGKHPSFPVLLDKSNAGSGNEIGQVLGFISVICACARR